MSFATKPLPKVPWTEAEEEALDRALDDLHEKVLHKRIGFEEVTEYLGERMGARLREQNCVYARRAQADADLGDYDRKAGA